MKFYPDHNQVIQALLLSFVITKTRKLTVNIYTHNPYLYKLLCCCRFLLLSKAGSAEECKANHIKTSKLGLVCYLKYA